MPWGLYGRVWSLDWKTHFAGFSLLCSQNKTQNWRSSVTAGAHLLRSACLLEEKRTCAPEDDNGSQERTGKSGQAYLLTYHATTWVSCQNSPGEDRSRKSEMHMPFLEGGSSSRVTQGVILGRKKGEFPLSLLLGVQMSLVCSGVTLDKPMLSWKYPKSTIHVRTTPLGSSLTL